MFQKYIQWWNVTEYIYSSRLLHLRTDFRYLYFTLVFYFYDFILILLYSLVENIFNSTSVCQLY